MEASFVCREPAARFPEIVASLSTDKELATNWPEKLALPSASITVTVFPSKPFMINLAKAPLSLTSASEDETTSLPLAVTEDPRSIIRS